MNENIERGLAAETHDKATVPLYASYVRDVPNGKGEVKTFDSHLVILHPLPPCVFIMIVTLKYDLY